MGWDGMELAFLQTTTPAKILSQQQSRGKRERYMERRREKKRERMMKSVRRE